MSATPLAHVLVPTPPQTATNTATSAVASGELGSGLGNRTRFTALTTPAYLTFGHGATAPTPTTSNGILVPAGASMDFWLPMGWKFKVISTGAGSLNWFEMAV